MQSVGYYLIVPLLYLISVLPDFLLYGIADILFLLVYHIFGYRKKVVTDNLKKSFPEKSDDEINKIRKKFYRYLCSLILETFRLLTISREKMCDVCKLDQSAIDIFEQYAKNKQSIITVMGHWGNWEWAQNAFSATLNQQLYIIYHPLHNKKFDELAAKMRTRFGTKMIAMKDTMREMLRHRNEICVTAFASDQTPPPEGAYWTKFLNQETPVFFGPEKISKKLNLPVVYISIKMISRGRYIVSAETLVADPSITSDGEISELHTKRLEKDIIEMPEIWLWSHRRWKHKRK
ncbi:MAG: lysophospholipid acyltransferase family protein [Bacteroidota bacterium]|jgi:KDO2-lipid IV(A) lauroyltransferase